MDTTPQPIAPDLQASLRHLRRIVLGGAAALVLLAGAAGIATPAHAAGKVSMNDLTVTIGKDPELPVTNIGKDPEIPVSNLTRKVNEYEGQHRLAAADPQPPRPPRGGCSACH